MQLFFQKNSFKIVNVDYVIKNAPEKKSESIVL